MSTAAIRKALENRLYDINPAFPTDNENDETFTPPAKAAFQRVTILFARPANPTMGDGFYRQRGYMQVDGIFPQGKGAGDADDWADAIRAGFPRGLDLTIDGVTTMVEPTPEIATGRSEGDRYVKPVRVYFYADIYT